MLVSCSYCKRRFGSNCLFDSIGSTICLSEKLSLCHFSEGIQNLQNSKRSKSKIAHSRLKCKRPLQLGNNPLWIASFQMNHRRHYSTHLHQICVCSLVSGENSNAPFLLVPAMKYFVFLKSHNDSMIQMWKQFKRAFNSTIKSNFCAFKNKTVQ